MKTLLRKGGFVLLTILAIQFFVPQLKAETPARPLEMNLALEEMHFHAFIENIQFHDEYGMLIHVINLENGQSMTLQAEVHWETKISIGEELGMLIEGVYKPGEDSDTYPKLIDAFRLD